MTQLVRYDSKEAHVDLHKQVGIKIFKILFSSMYECDIKGMRAPNVSRILYDLIKLRAVGLSDNEKRAILP